MSKRYESPFRFSMPGNWLFWVVLPFGVALILMFAGIFGVMLAFFPPIVSGITLAIMGLVVVWFVFARGRSNEGAVSEGSLMGRQTSRGGLL